MSDYCTKAQLCTDCFTWNLDLSLPLSRALASLAVFGSSEPPSPVRLVSPVTTCAPAFAFQVRHSSSAWGRERGESLHVGQAKRRMELRVAVASCGKGHYTLHAYLRIQSHPVKMLRRKPCVPAYIVLTKSWQPKL